MDAVNSKSQKHISKGLSSSWLSGSKCHTSVHALESSQSQTVPYHRKFKKINCSSYSVACTFFSHRSCPDSSWTRSSVYLAAWPFQVLIFFLRYIIFKCAGISTSHEKDCSQFLWKQILLGIRSEGILATDFTKTAIRHNFDKAKC